MRLKKRIFFTLFPVGYWVVIAVGIVFHFVSHVSQLGNVLINLGTFLVAYKVAVIIHETGHLIAAKAVGGTPRRVVLGKGHELYRTKILNIRAVINSHFLGGHAYASFEQPGFLKLRYGAFILGGVLLNVICGLVMSAFFEMVFTNSRGKVVIAIPFTIFLANSLMVLSGNANIPRNGRRFCLLTRGELMIRFFYLIFLIYEMATATIKSGRTQSDK